MPFAGHRAERAGNASVATQGDAGASSVLCSAQQLCALLVGLLFLSECLAPRHLVRLSADPSPDADRDPRPPEALQKPNSDQRPPGVVQNRNALLSAAPPAQQADAPLAFRERRRVPPYDERAAAAMPWLSWLPWLRGGRGAARSYGAKGYPGLRSTRSADDAGCLYFACRKNATACDDARPTDYHGSDPPCCTHVLRDLARAFDAAMVRLGLGYAAAFGTLLGLARADRMVPWTQDNDYLLPSADVLRALVRGWDVKGAGLALLFQGIPRLCATSAFAGGGLEKWVLPRKEGLNDWVCERGHPYIDLYVGKQINDEFSEEKDCRHAYASVFPTQRVLVYNGTLAQNIPADPEAMLRTYYGNNWRVPPDVKSDRGGRPCHPSG